MKELEKKLYQIKGVKILSQVKKESSRRATFNLASFGNDALEELSKRPGLKHKEIFDMVCEKEIILDFALDLAKKDSLKESAEKSVQKTLLLSEKSLKKINDISKREKIKRDTLASYIIFVFGELVKQEEEEEREGFIKGEPFISRVYSDLEEEQGNLGQEIGHDHPLVHAFGYVVTTCVMLQNAVRSHLDGTKPFDQDFF